MRRFILLASLAALATAAPAAAKGPSSASLTGPGLGHALPVKGLGERGPGTPLGALVQFGGFFPQVFGGVPDPTRRTRPAGDLGPRYRVVYRVPGPGGKSTIVQDVYPYAKPNPVTHMRAYQRFWDDMFTHGGWFVSRSALKATLVEVGVPKSPPTPGVSFPWAWSGAGAAGVVLLLVLALRRRGMTRFRVLRSAA
jgi:hypothetical protein